MGPDADSTVDSGGDSGGDSREDPDADPHGPADRPPLSRERIVAAADGLLSLCPRASRSPYEVLVAPLRPEADAFTSPLLAPALALLADAVRRLHAVEGRVPLNAWLHTGRHWHLELVPRLTVAAGLELGAGIYVNPLPPEEAEAAGQALIGYLDRLLREKLADPADDTLSDLGARVTAGVPSRR